MWRRLVPLTLAGALGCGSAANGPLSGEWAYADEVLEEDSCGIDYSPTSGTFFIENHEDGTFTVDPNDSTDRFLCTHDDGDYDCAERYVEDLEFFGAHARIHARAEGALSSARTGSGIQVATASCVDEGCEAIAAAAGLTTPCVVEVSYKIVFVE